MPNQIQKSLQDYISRMKKPTPQNQSPPTPTPTPTRSLSTSTSWILRGCKHPRTPSFSSDQNNQNETMQDMISSYDVAATLSDVDRFLNDNFKTLYENEDEEEDSGEIKRSIEDRGKPIEEISDSARTRRRNHPKPEKNHRFFVAPEDISSTSTTRTSASTIISDLPLRTSDDDDDHRDDAERVEEQMSPDDFITVLTYSSNPYDDFKKSMQEMMDARIQVKGKINWEFMEELLFCYLNLNDKKSHRFILGAFVDLILVLRENQGCVPAKPRTLPSQVGRRP